MKAPAPSLWHCDRTGHEKLCVGSISIFEFVCVRGQSGQGLWCCSRQHSPTASSLARDFPAVCGSHSSRDNAVPRVSSFLQLRDFPKQWDERLTAFFCACAK